MTLVNEEDVEDMILVEEAAAVPCQTQGVAVPEAICCVQISDLGGKDNQGDKWGCNRLSPSALSKFVLNVKSRLSPQPRIQTETPVQSVQQGSTEHAMFVSHGPYGIVDLGASQTVIGSQQVPELLKLLPQEVRERVTETPCRTVFRFGNSSTVMCDRAILVPLDRWKVKICVVESKTPFLISNNVFRTLSAQIDTASDHVNFSKLGFSLPLCLSEKKLYLLDFCELIRLGNSQLHSFSSSGRIAEQSVMSSEMEVAQENPSSVVQQISLTQTEQFSQQPVQSSFDVSDQPSNRVAQFGPDGHSQSCRSFPGSHHRAEARGISPSVVRTTVGDESRLWGEQGESTIRRCDPTRPKVCPVVCAQVCREQEGSTPSVPLLRGVVHGTSGTDSGNPPREQGGSSKVCWSDGEVQSSSPEDHRSGQPRKLVRIGTVGAEQAVECGSGRTTCDPRRTECPTHEDFQHRDQSLADHSPIAAVDPSGNAEPTCLGTVSSMPEVDEFRADLCDVFGRQQWQDQPEAVVDESYFSCLISKNQSQGNWVYEEMWQYFSKKFAYLSSEQVHQHWSKSRVHVMEIYCSDHSQLTHQGNLLGLLTVRFGLKQGDLGTYGGRCCLYDALWATRPQHIWLSPRCGPWSAWNRLNSCKSRQLAAQIAADRRGESVHLWLCSAMFQLQKWRQGSFHAHLEQPDGSEMVWQPELEEIVVSALKVQCDMCTAGQLRHPTSRDFLRKKTQVWTTSQIMWRMLQQYQCLGQHPHDTIAGSCKPHGLGRTSVSKFSELYTALFGKRICRAIQCSCQVLEKPMTVHTALTETHGAEDNEPSEPKRRRLNGKFHPEQLFEPLPAAEASPVSSSHSSTEDPTTQIQQLLQLADQSAPRVGKMVVSDGPLFEGVQQLYPDKQIMVVDVCRGANRLRTCPVGTKGFAPLRRCFGKRRTDLSIFSDASWESWETLSHRQQIRAGVPARIVVTVFANNKRTSTNPEESTSKRIRVDERKVDPTPETGLETSEPIQDSGDKEPNRVEGKQHGPLFLSLSREVQNQIKKIHQNLGHPDTRILQLALRRYGWTEQQVRCCADFVCPVCFEKQMPKIARPAQLRVPRDFNDHVSFDAAEWQDSKGLKFGFYHFIDSASNYHVAVPIQQQTTEGLIEAFNNAWLRWAGPPASLMFDSATEANSEGFARFLQEQAIQSYVIPTEAHWQLGRAERHGALLKHMISKYHEEHPIQNQQDFEQALIQLCNAKNAMSRHEGYTPEMWVLGKMKPVPGSNSNSFLDSASFASLEDQSPEGSRFLESLAKRESARLAFVKADHCASLRKALHARSRPDRMNFQVGEMVMYWRAGKGVEEGMWHGPGKILMVEGQNLVWVSHLTRLFRCAPEHIRKLSADEAQGISLAELQTFKLPERSGTGVFQFRELIGQTGPPQSAVPAVTRVQEPDVIVDSAPPSTGIEPPETNQIAPSVGQPDAEPTCPNGDSSSSSSAQGDSRDPAVDTPVPVDTDDDLVTTNTNHDFWEIKGREVIRHHVVPRLKMFFPHDAWNCPVAMTDLQDQRLTCGTYISGGEFQRTEKWSENARAHLSQPEPWVGTTSFQIAERNPALESLNTVQSHPCLTKCLEAEIFLTMDDFQKCLGKTYDYQENFLASAAKKQKVEVKVRDLNADDQKLFAQAKEKELESWISTETVQRILRNKVPEGQLLRSRWVLSWKTLDDVDKEATGMSRKAKARLVILGYEDPLIDSLPRDSPTLGRDSRMIALQCIASHRWSVRSFDIRTAFLRGSRQDSRILGMEPPSELRIKMGLQDNEVCELLKGAYGLINAPLLWYNELKNALLSIGFVISPFDPCVFVLPKKESQAGESQIHGVLGVHVDDGIGGGDQIFNQAISTLEKRFPFGSQRQGSFTFTGIHVLQEANGEIILSQKEYIQDINPIDVPKDRRKTPESPVTKQELQDLRGLIGSIQYAATNTRPDLSCRLSLLQARITCAQVSDLLQGNKILHDAKRFSDTSIRIQALDPNQLRFLSFSDAAFATREKANSQKGCLIMATTQDVDRSQAAPVSPLVWSSKKINRVVSSTLASETFALSGALDLLSWTRMHWSWILNPYIPWKETEKTLMSLPPAYAVVDCKSLFDLLQKTSIPQCSEYRTLLEALVIKDRLKEGVIIKWVHSAAQMADSLTKDMDTSVLRTFLKHGKCILHDAEEILKQRADKRVRQQWYQSNSTPETMLHAFALSLDL